jgi:hypothetical protein
MLRYTEYPMPLGANSNSRDANTTSEHNLLSLALVSRSLILRHYSHIYHSLELDFPVGM